MFAGRTFGSDLHLLRIQILDHLFVRGDLIEKDLGIWINRDLKPREQCIQSANKAQSVLGIVRRHFKEIDKEDFKIIYNTYVRPHLEYCEQDWSPYLQKDKTCLEKVQRRATKMVKGLKKLPYETTHWRDEDCAVI